MALNVKKTLLKAKSLTRKGETTEASRLYQSVLEHYPANKQARKGLAEVEQGGGAVGRGSPPPPEDLVRHLIALYSAGRLTEALEQARPLVEQHPQDPLLHNLLGATLAGLDMPGKAVASLQRAVRLKPDYVEAFGNLAAVYHRLRRFEEAIACYESVVRYEPHSSVARVNLLFERLQVCDWAGIWPAVNSILETGLAGEELNPFKMLVLDPDPARQRKRAQHYVRKLYLHPELPPIKPPQKSPDKLKVGYFSADFHDHATMYLMIRMFELHDSDQFEIYIYSYGPPSDSDLRRRLVAVSEFREVNHLTDKEVARLSRDDGIHVAVDLKGHTHNARTNIFAYRAAPVQINYLGYPGTLGAGFMDYIIADETIIPEESADEYTEEVIYLPGSYQVNDDSRDIAEHTPTREQAGLPEDGFVFCCFNNSYKITPAEFDIWMRLLQRVEGSVLWLLKANDRAFRNLRATAQSHGVEPGRIVFADRVPLPEHLARHRLADLFLDTFNYNAHTTASDALWMGLPVLTRLGQGFSGRVAGSLLRAVGLEETVCENAEEYESLALGLATDPQRLASIREQLATNRNSAPLFDSAAFTQAIEDAYQQTYQRFIESGTAGPIRISEL